MATLENGIFPNPGSLAKLGFTGTSSSYAIYLGRAKNVIPDWPKLSYGLGFHLVFWEQSSYSLEWYKQVRDVRPWDNRFIEWVWLKE